MSPDHTGTATGMPAAPLGDEELAAIAARLPVGGLFIAHAHTDMTRLLAEVHRLRHSPTALTAAQDTFPAANPRDYFSEQGANR